MIQIIHAPKVTQTSIADKTQKGKHLKNWGHNQVHSRGGSQASAIT